MKFWTLYRLIGSAALLAAAAAQAASPAEVAMSDAQVAALGVRLEAPQSAAEAGTMRFPARVSLPASAERAVVAPLPGTVETLLVGVGDTVCAGQPLATLFSAELSGLKSSHVQMQAAERLARADRDHVGVVVLAGQLRGGIGPHERGTDTDHLVGRDLLAVAGAADDDPEAVEPGGAGGPADVFVVFVTEAENCCVCEEVNVTDVGATDTPITTGFTVTVAQCSRFRAARLR